MKLRWSICGAGRVSSDYCHALLTLSSDAHEITSVASKSAERAKDFADKFNIKNSYGTYDELAEDHNVDIVYIGTWHPTHVALSKLMLNAGKHVLFEKPMCLNTDQVKEVFQLAEEKNKFFAEGLWNRSFPVYQKIREEIRSGNIGNVELVTVSLCLPMDSWQWNLERGDGLLMVLGMYTVQFANWVFNNEKPNSITAVGTLNSQGTDEDGCVILAYKNGAKASLSYSLKCKGENSATVFGSKGCIQIPGFIWCPVEATFPSGKVTAPLIPDDPSVYTYPNAMCFRYEAEDIRQCIMQGKTQCPGMLLEDSLTLYEILDDIRHQIGIKYDPETWKSSTL